MNKRLEEGIRKNYDTFFKDHSTVKRMNLLLQFADVWAALFRMIVYCTY
jgi:hypothetical protein